MAAHQPEIPHQHAILSGRIQYIYKRNDAMPIETTTSPNKFNAILKTALLAGTLDISGAFIHYTILTRNNPVKILYFIASALLGKDALSGGFAMAALGLFLHYLIAFIFTVFFFSIYPRLQFLSKNIVLTGLGYGLFVWLVMNLVVLPLSHIGLRPFNPIQSTIGILIILFAIGLPIAILTYRYYLKSTQV
ncbi:MAG: hypothetical protein QM764_02470 [Chitinophagaceae bacterium]